MKESIEHLLTVLRGKFQDFEAIDDGMATLRPWNDMRDYLTSWIEEDRKSVRAEVREEIEKKHHHPMTALESHSLKLKARNQMVAEILNLPCLKD